MIQKFFAVALGVVLAAGPVIIPVPEAAASQGADWCRIPRAPKVTIVPTSKPVKLNHTKTKAQLGTFHIDTQNPYGADAISHVGGIMKGEFNVWHNASFDGLVNNSLGQFCLWFDQVVVNIQVDPTIYIAREFPKGSCMYNAVLGHENKHVLVDREILKKYAQSIGAGLQKELLARPLYGPFPVGREESAKTLLQKVIDEVIYEVMGRDLVFFEKDRTRHHQMVDSLPEYERVNNLCPEGRSLLSRVNR